VIRIRLGSLADLPALQQIERETARMFSPSDLPATLAHPLPPAQVTAGVSASLLWVAEHAECSTPVGFILCERPTQACLHVREMDVRPAFARQGTGASMLSHVCSTATAQGLRFITLTTFSHLPWNAPFYAKHGFRVTDQFASFPHLAKILEHESQLGLRNRVAMVRSAV
jgi:GNAT superfamily N-acetyltransferase